VHTRAPTVIRLEGALALGHGSISLLWHPADSRIVLQRMRKVTRCPLVSSSSRSLTGAVPEAGAPRFAAVSPTFGRLFEGTDVNTVGQTASHQRHLCIRATQIADVKRHANKSSAMLQNGWPAIAKPVSFCQSHFREKRLHTSTHNEVRVPGRLLIRPPEREMSVPRPNTHAERQTKRAVVLSTPVDNHVDSHPGSLRRPCTEDKGGSC
jgi:hypothetical protein